MAQSEAELISRLVSSRIQLERSVGELLTTHLFPKLDQDLNQIWTTAAAEKWEDHCVSAMKTPSRETERYPHFYQILRLKELSLIHI